MEGDIFNFRFSFSKAILKCPAGSRAGKKLFSGNWEYFQQSCRSDLKWWLRQGDHIMYFHSTGLMEDAQENKNWSQIHVVWCENVCHLLSTQGCFNLNRTHTPRGNPRELTGQDRAMSVALSLFSHWQISAQRCSSEYSRDSASPLAKPQLHYLGTSAW